MSGRGQRKIGEMKWKPDLHTSFQPLNIGSKERYNCPSRGTEKQYVIGHHGAQEMMVIFMAHSSGPEASRPGLKVC